MKRAAAAAICAALWSGSPLAANVPETSPVPPARPDGVAARAVATVAREAGAIVPAAMRRPMPRPGAAQVLPAVTPAGLARSPVPKARPGKGVVRAASVLPKPGATSLLRGSVCGIASLKGTPIPPIASPVKGCGLADGVRITSVAGVPLSNPITVDCDTATALSAWTEKVLIPTVGTRGGGLARIDVMDSYACRPRNNVTGNRISEHGRGRAVDIGGFTLANGSSLTVLDAWGSLRSGPLMKAVFRGACGLFGTTLGPAANRFHRNHFHFDTARYRAGSYCE